MAGTSREALLSREPMRLDSGNGYTIRWRSRWTTPVIWQEYAGNPILTAGVGTAWDAAGLSTPNVIRVSDGYRIYYGSRPHIGMATGRRANGKDWTKVSAPILSAGSPGAFDAGGVNAPRVVPVTDRHWHMYHVGYHPTEKWGGMPVHQIGLSESEDGGLSWRHSFTRSILPRGEGSHEAFATTSCSVLRIGSGWMLWYGAIAQVPYLASICLAFSDDGHSWKKYDKNPVLTYNPYFRPEAFVVASPNVMYDQGLFKMWYSARGLTGDCRPGEYTVCYAESKDGIRWERFPGNPVLFPGSSGWDQKMVEYAQVLKEEVSTGCGFAETATAPSDMQKGSGPRMRPFRFAGDRPRRPRRIGASGRPR